MYVYHNIEKNSVLNIENIYTRENIVQQLKSRFKTYGYREITTSVFEKYNLYATMNGTVNHREMIKTIDNTGQVLVLRPDITIPLTKEIATNGSDSKEDLRYFYVLDVYRQTYETKEYRQHTQAGVEYFGNPSVEADGEIIALATHVLKDLNVENFTIELGHAGFFKQIVEEVNIERSDFLELKRYIQRKNIPEMERLLGRLSISKEMRQIIGSLPFLYGKLQNVLEKTAELPLSEPLKEKLANIQAIYDVLEAYDVTEHIVIDLSLINHMDYYSDIIFQGFIEKVGKPVLMGGRYDTLAQHFSTHFPAIGFAYDVDLLLAGSAVHQKRSIPKLDFVIQYEKHFEKQAISLAQQLRNNNFDILTYVIDEKKQHLPQAKAIIAFTNKSFEFQKDNLKQTFTTNDEALQTIYKVWEET